MKIKYDHNQIKIGREEKGLTEKEAACSILASESQWKDWERGKITPGANMISKICKAIGKPIGFLFVVEK